MPHFTQITRDFGDGAHVFAFPLGAFRELEDKRNASVPEIQVRISMWKFKIDDVRETIRIALVHGGAVTPVQAMRLVERYVDGQPIENSVGLAIDILRKALYVPEDDAPQKKSEDENPSQESSPTFASSTATVQ
jgi:Phage tail tube protein, GTA-gp10